MSICLGVPSFSALVVVEDRDDDDDAVLDPPPREDNTALLLMLKGNAEDDRDETKGLDLGDNDDA